MSDDAMVLCEAMWHDHDCNLPIGHDGNHMCTCGVTFPVGTEE